jgi:hypothetical protein
MYLNDQKKNETPTIWVRRQSQASHFQGQHPLHLDASKVLRAVFADSFCLLLGI